MVRRSCVPLLVMGLVVSTDAVRRLAHERTNQTKAQLRLEDIGCPVMAAIVKRGLATPDAHGRIDQVGIIRGLMGTGNSKEMSAFQALGIAGFKPDDLHQVNRIRQKQPGDLGLNFYNWNPRDSCSIPSNRPNLKTGVPCNANIEFQQHGFSTEMRDPKNGKSQLSKFKNYFTKGDVLKQIPGVNGWVMTHGGMSKLLKQIRSNGDKSGENSLTANNQFKNSLLSFFHPSANKKDDYVSLSQWQAVMAWSAFFVAFSSTSSRGTSYMSESDLKRFFMNSDFPSDWKASSWGFRETFKLAASLDGSGAGDHWTQKMKASLAAIGTEATELQYSQALLGHTRAGNLDHVHHSWP